MEDLVARLEAVTKRLEGVQAGVGGSGGGGGGAADEDPGWLDDFNALYKDVWVKFIADTKAQGGGCCSVVEHFVGLPCSVVWGLNFPAHSHCASE